MKNQIRGLARLLKKDGLDPRVRAKEEAKLAGLLEALEAHRASERERAYAVRYHKVRFFERVKLERRIRRLQAAMQAAQAGGGEPAPGDAAALAQAQDDLQYVLHFPRGEKYVALLKPAADPAAAAALQAERARLRALVRAQLAEAALAAR
ncbi:hypothetical protein WJX81_004393 [Elliptochloris bilobata]|uniref:rRNA-processing protein EFG1 n=1 Tax=Elliptochloris bilobata TaxID=381761 RepID=A0AAW1QVX8_9CHLO